MKKFIKMIVFILVSIFCFGLSISASEINQTNYNDKDYNSAENTNLSQDELDAIIVQQEREKRKSELNGLRYSTDEERYAAFFGAKYDFKLDTRPDVTLSDTWFQKMKYITEPFTQPVFRDLDRRYYCTDVITISGHGSPNMVQIGCVEENRTEDNCIGVKAETSNSADKIFKYVGIGKRDLSYCRFMMFIACQTANGKENITKYAVDHNAQAAIGWSVDIDSRYTKFWLEKFYTRLYNGDTIAQAKNSADVAISSEAAGTADSEKRAGLYSLTNSSIYGNSKQKLSYNPSREAKNDTIVKQIKEPINIDCENQDLDELIDYLEKNVAGFSKETCQLTNVNNNIIGENNYNLLFEKYYNGFITNEFIFVLVNDDEISYFSNLKQLNEPKQVLMKSTDISTDVIEKAKAQALKDIDTEDEVDSQIVEKRLDEDYKPYLLVKTRYVDAQKAFWARNYVYYLE